MTYLNTLQSTVNQIRAPESSTNQNQVLRQVVKKSSDKSSWKRLFDENICGKQYLNNCTYTITSLWNYYLNTIGDMQDEMDFYGLYNEFENNHDLVVFIIVVVIIFLLNFTYFQFFKR